MGLRFDNGLFNRIKQSMWLHILPLADGVPMQLELTAKQLQLWTFDTCGNVLKTLSGNPLFANHRLDNRTTG